MNGGLLALNVVTGGNLKKQAALVLATMAIIVALPFAAVFSMGESVVSFLSGVPSLAAAESQGFYTGGPVEGDTYANANTWDDRAIRDGYIVNHTPEVGAVFQTDNGEWGHVAYVASVNNQSGEWAISEMNFLGLNILSRRTFSADAASSYTFIHGKKGAASWSPLPISLP